MMRLIRRQGEMKWYDEIHYNIYSFEKMMEDSPEMFSAKNLYFMNDPCARFSVNLDRHILSFQKNFRDTKMKWSVRWTK